MYPNTIVIDPSSSVRQPSYAGDTTWPLEYVNRVCALTPANKAVANSAESNSRLIVSP
jgi:hypothetical protein